MRKEILIAIVLGIFVGIIVAFGVWRANTAFKGNASKSVQVSQNENEDASDPQTLNITVANPENYDVLVSSPVTASGIATQGTWVVISSETEDFITQTNGTGAFEQNIEPVGGINQLIFAAFNEEGQGVRQALTIVFSTEFANEIITDAQEESDEEEDEADAVRERVEARLQESRLNPKAALGAVTDKTEDALQIRNVLGEIKLISINPELTSFVSINGSTAEVNFDDVAIGDFIVAMGFSNGNGVLDARRVLLTGAPEAPSREIIFGEVLSTQGRAATIRTPNNGEVAIDFPTRWKGPEVDELYEGTKVIAVLVEDEGDRFVRTIEIVSSQPPPSSEE